MRGSPIGPGKSVSHNRALNRVMGLRYRARAQMTETPLVELTVFAEWWCNTATDTLETQWS